MISQKYFAAWRDSELETCMPTDWYSIYLTSPIRPKSTTFAEYCFPFADPPRIFRGHTTLHVKTVLHNSHTRTFRSMLIYVYIYIYMHMYCGKSHCTLACVATSNVFSKTFIFNSVCVCLHIYHIRVYMSATRRMSCTCIHYIARHAQMLTNTLGAYMSENSRMHSNPSYEQTLPSDK